MGKPYSSKKKHATKKKQASSSGSKKPSKKTSRKAPATTKKRSEVKKKALPTKEALSRKRALAQKRARKAKREYEAELARKRAEAARKGWKTRRKLARLKKPRATPKSKEQLREQSDLLQEKLAEFSRQRVEQTKREAEKRARELEAEKARQQAEVAIGRSTSKLPLSPTEQARAIEESAERIKREWNQIIIRLRKDKQLPEPPLDYTEVDSRMRTGHTIRVDLDVDLNDDTMEDVLYEIERASLGLEKRYGDMPTWMFTITCVSYGPKLIHYGILMLNTFDLDMSQIQTRGVINTGIWTSIEEMMIAAKKELKKTNDSTSIIRLLWATVDAADRKTEEQQKDWDKRKRQRDNERE